MSRDVNLLTYLPEFLQVYREFLELSKTENPEIKLLWDEIEAVTNNQFIQDANENGIKRYEVLLKIRSAIGEDIETRRFRVLSRWNDAIPYTYRSLLAKLDVICGKDNYDIVLDNTNYQLNLVVHLGVYGSIDELHHILDIMIPANLELEVNNVLIESKETNLYFGSVLVNSMHYVLTNDINTSYEQNGSSKIASVVVDSQRYLLSSDIIATQTVSGNTRLASTNVIGSKIEIS